MEIFLEIIAEIFGEWFFNGILKGIVKRLFRQELQDMPTGRRRLAIAVCFLPAVISLMIFIIPIVFLPEWLKALGEYNQGQELIPARKVLLIGYPVVTGLVILWIILKIRKIRR